MKPLPPSTSDIVSLPPKRLDAELNTHYLEESLNHLQDDEIVADANKAEAERILYKDSVEMLTDETLPEMLKKTDLLVVLFYIQFDDSSYLFLPTFAKINDELGSSCIKVYKL